MARQKGYQGKRGIYLDVRHAVVCPLHGEGAVDRRNPERCRCSPSAYAQVKRKWVEAGELERGWGLPQLEEVELEAFKRKQGHDSGRKLIVREQPPLMSELAEEWLTEFKADAEADGYSPNTVSVYSSRWHSKLAPAIGDELV